MIGVRVGMGFERDGRFAQIISLVVDAKCRSKGIGRLLVETAEEWARLQPNVDKIIVATNIRRTETHRFYEIRNGYAKTGYRFVKEFSTQKLPSGVSREMITGVTRQ